MESLYYLHTQNCCLHKENDLLTAYRNKEDIELLIRKNIESKFAVRSGMSSPESFEDPKKHANNRSMIRIGG